MSMSWLPLSTLKSKAMVMPTLKLKDGDEWHPSPLNLSERSMIPIPGTFHVELNPTREGDADVSLNTSYGDISVTLYLSGGTSCYIALIKAISTGGNINLTLAKRQSRVNITAITQEGSVHLHIPRDFNGLLTMSMSLSATPGDVYLSKRLQKKAALVQDRNKDSNRFVTFRVGRNTCKMTAGCGCDRVDVQVSDGDVVVGFATDV